MVVSSTTVLHAPRAVASGSDAGREAALGETPNDRLEFAPQPGCRFRPPRVGDHHREGQQRLRQRLGDPLRPSRECRRLHGAPCDGRRPRRGPRRHQAARRRRHGRPRDAQGALGREGRQRLARGTLHRARHREQADSRQRGVEPCLAAPVREDPDACARHRAAREEPHDRRGARQGRWRHGADLPPDRAAPPRRGCRNTSVVVVFEAAIRRPEELVGRGHLRRRRRADPRPGCRFGALRRRRLLRRRRRLRGRHAVRSAGSRRLDARVVGEVRHRDAGHGHERRRGEGADRRRRGPALHRAGPRVRRTRRCRSR